MTDLFAVYPLLELFYKLSPNVVFQDILMKEIDFQAAESAVTDYDEYVLLEPVVLPDIYYMGAFHLS